jgi:hypothetical protein
MFGSPFAEPIRGSAGHDEDHGGIGERGCRVDDGIAVVALVARPPVPPITPPTLPVPDPGGIGSDGRTCNFGSARRRARSLKFRGWPAIGQTPIALTAGANAPVLSAHAIVAEEDQGDVISNRHEAIDMPRCCGAIEPRRSAVGGAIAPGVVGRQSAKPRSECLDPQPRLSAFNQFVGARGAVTSGPRVPSRRRGGGG